MSEREEMVELFGDIVKDTKPSTTQLLMVAEFALREVAARVGPVERSRPVREMIRTLVEVQKEGL